MGKRPLAVSAALSIALVGLTPLAVHANCSTPTTYYVADSPSTCSDSGPGTQTDPFCTVSHAAATATVPGDTVLIGQGGYTGEIDIAASGTAAAPITFEAENTSASAWNTIVASGASPSTFGLDISGASYIDVSGLRIQGSTTNGQVAVNDSSHITLDHIWAIGGGSPNNPVFAVTGTSSDVTLSRDVADAGSTNGTGILVESSGGGNVVTTDYVDAYNVSAGISILGSPQPVVMSNTVTGYCGAGISVADDNSGSVSGAQIENNVVITAASASTSSAAGCLLSGTSVPGISVQTGNTVGTLVSHNTIYPNSTAYPWAYSWLGTDYATAADFAAATGQGAGDSTANPLTDSTGFAINESAETINSADSDAPGELSTDIDYNPRIDDTNVPETGGGSTGGYDRGALQFTEKLTPGALTYPVTAAPVGGSVTFTAPKVTSDWANATFTYTYNFGDGTSPVTTASKTYAHAFSKTGAYTVTVAATSNFGTTATVAGFPITIQASVTFGAQLNVSPIDALGVTALPVITTAWPITTEALDFGDGTGANLLQGGSDQHTYKVPGTYTVTATLGDAGGDSKSVTTTFTTAGNDFVPFGPTRLLDTRSNLGGSSSQLAGNGSIKLKIAGLGGIPAGIKAVDLNLTAVGATGNGYLQAGAGTGDTGTSNLNYFGSPIFSNGAIVPVAPDGTVTLSNHSTRTSSTLSLIADISGYFLRSDTGSQYVALSPLRVLDTRSDLGGDKGRLTVGKTDVLKIAGAPDTPIPTTDVTAVSINLTEVATTGAGFLNAYADGKGRPDTSSVDWQGSTTHAADVLVDVTGFFSSVPVNSIAAGTTVYVPVAPQRVLDTRQSGSLGQGQTQALDMSGVDGTPTANGTSTPSYVLNTTVTDTQATGYLAAGPNLAALGGTSMLNWAGADQTVANLSFVDANPVFSTSTDIDSDEVYFYYGGSSGQPVSIDVLVDLTGYFWNQ